MSEQNHAQSFAESISALVDNQASELELQRILKACEQNSEVAATWARYQIVGSVLRGEKVNYKFPSDLNGKQKSSVTLPLDFAARVSAAVAGESEHQVLPKKQGLWYQLGRVALVASVAGGMIVGVQQFDATGSLQAEVAVASGAVGNHQVTPTSAPAVSLPSRVNTQAINTRTVAMQTGYENRPQESRRVMFKPHPSNAAAVPAVSNEEVTRYVNEMIQAHSDNAVMNSNQGILPYARVVVSDEE